MSNLNLAPTTTPSIALLANVLFKALQSTTLRSAGWPFAPESYDFSQVGDVDITLDGLSAKVVFRFKGANSPVLSGLLDLGKLQGQLVSAPNYVDFINSSPSNNQSQVVFTSAPITKQASGVMYVSAGAGGSQSAQDPVLVDLWRDYGTPNQLHLAGPRSMSPGGVAGYSWLGHIAKIDILPDGSAHTYSLVCTGQGGSLISIPASAAGVQVFEIGGTS